MATPQRVTGDNWKTDPADLPDSATGFNRATNYDGVPIPAANSNRSPITQNPNPVTSGSSPTFSNLKKTTRPTQKINQGEKNTESRRAHRLGQQAVGTSIRVAGKTTNVAGKGVSAAGAGVTRAGAALSTTGVGAIVGVPLMAVGGATTAAGRGVSAAGKSIDKGGRTVNRRARATNRRERFARRQKTTVSNNLKRVAMLEIWVWTGFVYISFLLPIALFTNFALFAYWSYLYATDSMLGGLLDSVVNWFISWFFDLSSLGFVFLFAFFACYLLLAAVHYLSLAMIYINCRALLIHPLSGGGQPLKILGFFVAAVFIWVPVINVFPLYWVWLSQIQLSPK